jgi:proteasome lid subunit RPN8/RPN11
MAIRIRLSEKTAEQPIRKPMPVDECLQWISPHQAQVDPIVIVVFAQTALSQCVEHTNSDLENEVGGILVGEFRIDPLTSRQYILVFDAIAAKHTHSGQTHVTFTRETMVQINAEMESRHPGKRIVGWYHTHPNLGVFMSNYDTWLHEHFFDDPLQVALVVDPGTEQGGFFCWQADHHLDPIHYVGFYEWGDAGDESIVEWNNLEPVIVEESEQPLSGSLMGSSDEQAASTLPSEKG